MPITIPANRIIPLQAKSGGGFRSDGLAVEANYTPMVAENFATGSLGSASADWTRSTYQNSFFKSGSQALELKTDPAQAAPTCGGVPWFGGRQALVDNVPLGNAIWQRFYMYIPSAFSFGYAYNKYNQWTATQNYTAGADTIVLTEVTNRVISPLTAGEDVAVQLDDTSWHFTTSAAGTDDATKTIVLSDALPSAASTGNLVYLGIMAKRQKCGDGAGPIDGGGSSLKWLCFLPDVSTLVTYINSSCVPRSVTGGGAIRRILIETSSQSIDPIGGVDVPFPRDQWFSLQLGMKVSNTGDGWVRAWLNDQLAVERLNINTVTASDTAIRAWGIGDYWNGLPFSDGQPGRDTFYIDDIIVASDMAGYGAPDTTDAAGNPYISPDTLAGDF